MKYNITIKKINKISSMGKQKEPKHCGICKKQKKIFHKHHVTYEPEVIVEICSICHERITRLNILISIACNHKLSNYERDSIWSYFCKNTGFKVPDRFLRKKFKFKEVS